MKKLTNLSEVLAFQLEGMYDGEKKLQHQLPTISERVRSSSVKGEISKCIERAVEKRCKLKRIFSYLLIEKSKRKSNVMESILNEAENLLHHVSESYVGDVVLLACLQSANHYNIANYRAALALALALNLEQVADLLDEILQVEKETTTGLEKIAFKGLQKQESIPLT